MTYDIGSVYIKQIKAGLLWLESGWESRILPIQPG